MDARPDPVRIVGEAIRSTRVDLGWSQRELASRAETSSSVVSRVERGEVPGLSIRTLGRILACLGARLDIRIDSPILGGGPRQRDPAHARLSGYVVRRLRDAGWTTATEVEVGGDRSRGWIDILAFHQDSRLVLVIELKTEIHDLGAIERSLNWYEREAWAAARRLGWRPRRTSGWLLLLATEANDGRVLSNRVSIDAGFPQRSRHLAAIVAGAEVAGTARGVAGTAHPVSGTGRGVAMIDPRSRRRSWYRPLRIDGRSRSTMPYRDYADFMRRITLRGAPTPTPAPTPAPTSARFPPDAQNRR